MGPRYDIDFAFCLFFEAEKCHSLNEPQIIVIVVIIILQLLLYQFA